MQRTTTQQQDIRRQNPLTSPPRPLGTIASRKPQAASRKPQAASRKPQAASERAMSAGRQAEVSPPDSRNGGTHACFFLPFTFALLLGALCLFPATAAAQTQSVPQNVAVTEGDAKLTLTWQTPSSWASTQLRIFEVQWKLSSGGASTWARVQAGVGETQNDIVSRIVPGENETSAEFTGTQRDHNTADHTVSNGTAYDLRIRAVSGGSSEHSSTWVTVSNKVPLPPYAQALAWSATLNPVLFNFAGLRGCHHEDSSCADQLSPSTFTHGGTSYAVTGVVTSPGGTFNLHTNPALPKDLALVVGGNTWLQVGDALHAGGGAGNIYWRDIDLKNPSLDWTSGNPVTLQLVEPPDDVPTVTLSASPNPTLEGETTGQITATLSSALDEIVVIPVRFGDALGFILVSIGATTGTTDYPSAWKAQDAGVANPYHEAYNDETYAVRLTSNLPTPVRPGDRTSMYLHVIDDDSRLPTVELAVSPSSTVTEGSSLKVYARLSRRVRGGASIPLSVTAVTAEAGDYSVPLTVDIPAGHATGSATITTAQDADSDDERFTVALGTLPDWVTAGSRTSFTITIRDDDETGQQTMAQQQVVGANAQGSQPGAVPQTDTSALISRMWELRNNPRWVWLRAHTLNWDRALLALGETVSDSSLTPMTAAEAQALADRPGWTNWVPVAEALKAREAGVPEPRNAPPVGGTEPSGTPPSGTEPPSGPGQQPPEEPQPLTPPEEEAPQEQGLEPEPEELEPQPQEPPEEPEPVEEPEPDPEEDTSLELREGGPYNDMLSGDDGGDEMYGHGGHDALFGRGGHDLLFGGSGNDVLNGGPGNDELHGGADYDTLIGGPGADRFVFSAGDTGGKTLRDFDPGDGDAVVLKGDSWPSVADIIASVEAVGTGSYRYLLSDDLEVETMNRPLRAEDFRVE